MKEKLYLVSIGAIFRIVSVLFGKTKDFENSHQRESVFVFWEKITEKLTLVQHTVIPIVYF